MLSLSASFEHLLKMQQQQNNASKFTFQVVNAPQIQTAGHKARKCQFSLQRPASETEKLLQAIISISRDHEVGRKAGLLVIQGDEGIGKTSLLSKLLCDPEHNNFFINDCKLRQSVWFNCFQWRQRYVKENSDSFLTSLAKLTGSEDGQSPKRDHHRRIPTLYVFDDVYHLSLIETIRSFIVDGLFMPCIVLVRSRDCSSMQLSATWGRIVTRVEEIPRFSNHQVVEILRRSRSYTNGENLRRLVDQCQGVPREIQQLVPESNRETKKLPKLVPSVLESVDTAIISDHFNAKHQVKEPDENFFEIDLNLRKAKTFFSSILPNKPDLISVQKMTTAIDLVQKDLKLINVPQHQGPYYARQSEEEKLLQAIRRVASVMPFVSSNDLATNPHLICLITLTGPSGIGKTTLMARMLSDKRYQASVLQKYCKLDMAIWLTCGADETPSDFAAAFEELFRQINLASQQKSRKAPQNEEKPVAAPSINRVLFVLDDFPFSKINQDQLLLLIRQSAVKNNCTCILVTIGSDPYPKSSPSNVVTMERMADWHTVDMFETVFSLKDKLSSRNHLLAIANSKLSHGLPIIGSLVASILNFHRLDDKTYKQLLKIQALKANQSTTLAKILDLALGSLPEIVNFYNAFLLFDPGESISLEKNLPFLVHEQEKGFTVNLCQKFEAFNLIIIYQIQNKGQTKPETFVKVHPLLFDAAYHRILHQNQTSQALNLSKVRLSILLDLLKVYQLSLPSFIDLGMRSQHRALIDRLLQRITPLDMQSRIADIFNDHGENQSGMSPDEEFEARDLEGWTGIMLTAKYGHFELLRHQLVALKQNQEICHSMMKCQESSHKMTALMFAVKYQQFETVRLLLSFEYDQRLTRNPLISQLLKQQNKDGQTALMIAVQQTPTATSLEIIRMLANKSGDDVFKITDGFGDSVISLAAVCSNLNALKIMAASQGFIEDHHAIMTLQNQKGDTALLKAIQITEKPVSLELVRWLVDRCSDLVRYQDYQGRNCLHLTKHLPSLIYLYEKLPEAIAFCDMKGRTPLMSAILEETNQPGQMTEQIRFLASNCSLDHLMLTSANTCRTALMFAVDGRQLGTVKLILALAERNYGGQEAVRKLIEQKDSDKRNVLERAIVEYSANNCSNCTSSNHLNDLQIFRMLYEPILLNGPDALSETAKTMRERLKTIVDKKRAENGDDRKMPRQHAVFLHQLANIMLEKPKTPEVIDEPNETVVDVNETKEPPEDAMKDPVNNGEGVSGVAELGQQSVTILIQPMNPSKD